MRPENIKRGKIMATKKNEVSVANQEVAAFDPAKLKIKQRLAVPTISVKKMKQGDQLYIRAESEIKYVEQIDEKTGDIKTDKNGEKELLPVIHCTELQSGMFGQLVLSAVAVRAMKLAEADGPLKGRHFAMMHGGQVDGQQGRRVTLWEIVEFENQ